MDRHVYLHSDNAEEILPDVISLIKRKAYWDSRKKAFEDCTNYWKTDVQKIIKSDLTDSEKLDQINKMFGS